MPTLPPNASEKAQKALDRIAILKEKAINEGIDIDNPVEYDQEGNPVNPRHIAYIKLIAESQSIFNYLNDPVRLEKKEIEESL